jgi:hypothetical protein
MVLGRLKSNAYENSSIRLDKRIVGDLKFANPVPRITLMNLRSCLPICTGILALFISSPAWATHVDRPASGHGTDDTCSSGADNCQSFGTQFTASDGLIVTPYTFDDDPPNFTYLDLFAVTGINAGTTVSFTFTSLPSDTLGQFGVFTCDGTAANPGQAVDAIGAPIGPTPSPCTGIPSSQTASSFLSNPTGLDTTWTFSSNGGLTTWWFYALATGTTKTDESAFLPTSVTVTGSSGTVPEPGTLLLLASGIVGLAVLRRREAHS